jgi:hypothetical protein
MIKTVIQERACRIIQCLAIHKEERLLVSQIVLFTNLSKSQVKYVLDFHRPLNIGFVYTSSGKMYYLLDEVKR